MTTYRIILKSPRTLPELIGAITQFGGVQEIGVHKEPKATGRGNNATSHNNVRFTQTPEARAKATETRVAQMNAHKANVVAHAKEVLVANPRAPLHMIVRAVNDWNEKSIQKYIDIALEELTAPKT